MWPIISSKNASIISIDLPGGEFGGGYPLYKSILFKSFKRWNQNITLIRGDSHDKKTINKVKNKLKGKKIDFLFIDGDHTYEGVKKDFNNYLSLCSPNAIIAIHDINVDNRDPRQIFVSEFWDELEQKYEVKKFISPLRLNAMGIGIINLGEQ